ncbi:MAG: VanW family protein [Lachnospiraceae bacterium]
MARKLFCEYGPVFYQISKMKEALKKDAKDLAAGRHFASRRDTRRLKYVWKSYEKPMMRKLEGVDMQLQRNKVTNLRLAGARIDGIIIRPGQEFSFWHLVGNASKREGYKEGLTISHGKSSSGIGGGLCQLANMIHWLVLHSPLEVTELNHHSDALFPDSNRREPFGSGTSICYKSLDYRFRNNTDGAVQIHIWTDDEFLYGELLGQKPLEYEYEIIEEDHHYIQEEDGLYYRCSKVYKLAKDKDSGQIVSKELILDNHSRVMFDYDLIPKDQIRN